MLDFVLASAHHLAAFLLFGALFVQLVTLRPGIGPEAIRRLAAVDAVYGLSAVLILVAGVARVLLAAKGWYYYQHNAAFWAKMALFLGVGLLSIVPTMTIRRWRTKGSPPADGEVRKIRGYLHAEAVLFALIPIAAAAMARGYGSF